MTLKDKKGIDYERAFYENTIKHHQALSANMSETPILPAFSVRG